VTVAATEGAIEEAIEEAIDREGAAAIEQSRAAAPGATTEIASAIAACHPRADAGRAAGRSGKDAGPIAEATHGAAAIAAAPALGLATVAVAVAARPVAAEAAPVAAGGGGDAVENLVRVLSVVALAMACTSHPAKSPENTQSAEQRGYSTPAEAAQALIVAAAAYDVPALLAILGPDGEVLITSADPVEDKARAAAFAAKAREKNRVEIDPGDPARAILVVGNDDWPVPVPLVAEEGRWYFDTEAGRDEILLRRIGANELDVITVSRGYVEAQQEYASEVHDGSGVHQYAQRIISTEGKRDGLAWRNSDGTWGGPVGSVVAAAMEQGYAARMPFHGYYFKILKGQGPAARLGQLDYVVDGAMIGGFALVAWPAEYGVTGVQTFMVSYDGVVYQKDLGPSTPAIAAAMDRYNPDETWKPTNDGW
jgi:Protein of unknown function (DUF2950)